MSAVAVRPSTHRQNCWLQNLQKEGPRLSAIGWLRSHILLFGASSQVVECLTAPVTATI